MDPVEAQLEAYNARDAERFVACFAEDVVVEDGLGAVLLRGREAMRASYGAMFAANPALCCHVVSRIRIGAFVVDEERITGRGETELHAVVIYRVAEAVITSVRILR